MIGDEKLYRAVHDPFGHLAEAGDGGLLGAVLNNLDNTLMGQARFFEVDPEDLASNGNGTGNNHDGDLPPVLIAAAGVALGILATVVVVKTAPTIKSWWLSTARPGIQGLWERLMKRREIEAETELKPLLEISTPVEPSAISNELVLIMDGRKAMSSAEAQQRYLAMMLAVAFTAEQIRILEEARVEDPENLKSLKRAAAQLSTQEAVDLANRMIDSDDSLLDHDSQAMFVAVFGGGRKVDGKYLQIKRDRVEKAMRFSEDNEG